MDLLAEGSEGELPYTVPDFEDGSRPIGDILSPDEIRDQATEFEDGLIPIAVSGDGSVLLVSGDERLSVEAVSTDGSTRRYRKALANSIDEFFDRLIPVEQVLEDLLKFRLENGRPWLEEDIADLRRRIGS